MSGVMFPLLSLFFYCNSYYCAIEWFLLITNFWIFCISSVLGKDEQTESDWPRESRVLPHSFRSRPERTWAVAVPGIDPVGLNLLKQMLTFNPLKRITAQQALNHECFEHRSIPSVDVHTNTELDLEEQDRSSTRLLNTSPTAEDQLISDDSITSPRSLNSTSADDSGYSSMYSHS